MRIDRSELLCDKVLLNIKEIEKTSDTDIKKGDRKSAPLIVFSKKLYTYMQTANKRKEMSQNSESGTRLLTHRCILR